MADPFTMTHLLMAATAGAALPSILGGKGKGLGITKDAIAEPSEEEKLHTEDLKLKTEAS
jgi:hypothetical protein